MTSPFDPNTGTLADQGLKGAASGAGGPILDDLGLHVECHHARDRLDGAPTLLCPSGRAAADHESRLLGARQDTNLYRGFCARKIPPMAHPGGPLGRPSQALREPEMEVLPAEHTLLTA